MRTAFKRPGPIVRALAMFAVVRQYARAAEDVGEPLSSSVQIFERPVVLFFLRVLVLLVRICVAVAAEGVQQVQAKLERQVGLSVLALSELLLQLRFWTWL